MAAFKDKTSKNKMSNLIFEGRVFQCKTLKQEIAEKEARLESEAKRLIAQHEELEENYRKAVAGEINGSKVILPTGDKDGRVLFTRELFQD